MSLLNIEEAMDRILTAIADQSSLVEACTAAGVSVGAHYTWLKSRPDYAEGYKFALQIRTRGLEDTLNRRAVDGYDEVKTEYAIMPDGTEMPVSKVVTRKHDNALGLRLLAANDDKFNPKIKAEVTDTRNTAEILASARKRLANNTEKPADECPNE